jgi:hypothetical protein
MDLRDHRGIRADDVDAAQLDRSPIRAEQARQVPKQDGFPAAAASDDGQELAGPDVEREAPEHRPRAEGLMEIAD